MERSTNGVSPSGNVYVNANGIFNDDRHEYETPPSFLEALAQLLRMPGAGFGSARAGRLSASFPAP